MGLAKITAAQRLEIRLRDQAGEGAQLIAERLRLPISEVEMMVRFTRKQGHLTRTIQAPKAAPPAIRARYALEELISEAKKIAACYPEGSSAHNAVTEVTDRIEKRLSPLLSAQAAQPAPASDELLEVYYEALVQADLKIRSLPGTDQSDVEFIRTAIANHKRPQP